MRSLALLVLAAAGCADAGRLHRAGVAATGTLRQAQRPDTPDTDEPFAFDPGDAVETLGSADGRFLLHFTRAGTHAVPDADTDGSGAPDFVEQAAGLYEAALAKYLALGFRAPLPDDAATDGDGGDARFDVYFVDFGLSADGAFRADGCLADQPRRCYGHLVQENDFAGYGYPSTRVANRILASHELFHAVQAAYDTGQGSVLSEGTAVWATETFDPTLGDFEGFIDGYLNNPDRTLDLPLPGPVDPFSYGSAIFFKFLSERFGADVVVELWSACEGPAGAGESPRWMDALDGVLRAHGSSFAEAFVDFARRNLFTGTASDPTRGYAYANRYPPVKMEAVQAPYAEPRLRVFSASAQYYRFATAERAEIAAALVPSVDGPASVEGLAVLVALRQGARYGTVTRLDDPTRPQAVSTGGADTAVVLVVNTNRAGNSKRPGLCLGSTAEVASCVEQLAPVEAPDAGPPDAGAADAGDPGGGGDASGCGCQDARAAVLALAGLLARRRRASSGSAASHAPAP